MTYKAATRFADLTDNRHIYEAGDTFPRPGLSVSENRLAELAGSNNRSGHPLIKAVPEPQKRTTEPTKPVQKRRTARRKGDAE